MRIYVTRFQVEFVTLVSQSPVGKLELYSSAMGCCNTHATFPSFLACTTASGERPTSLPDERRTKTVSSSSSPSATDAPTTNSDSLAAPGTRTCLPSSGLWEGRCVGVDNYFSFFDSVLGSPYVPQIILRSSNNSDNSSDSNDSTDNDRK